MVRVIRRVLFVVTGVVLVTLVGLAADPVVRRIVLVGMPSVDDFDRLPSRAISASPSPRPFVRAAEGDRPETIDFCYEESCFRTPHELFKFLEARGTTSFVVVRSGEVIWESYFNGAGPDSLLKTFSISKSVLSALIGIAIDEGLIGSTGDQLNHYIPELKDSRAGNVTLRQCLDNTAGFRYRRGRAPWNERTRMYYTTDLRSFLRNVKVERTPGSSHRSEELSPLLLGNVLDRALNAQSDGPTTISEYMERRLWHPLGAEYGALWNLDRRDAGLEKTESGFTARAVDLAKFGQLYLQRGRVADRQLVSESWICRSTTIDRSTDPPNAWKLDFYTHLWWGVETGQGQPNDFYANGHFGQRIYVSPSADMVLVRTGKQGGGVRWARFLGDLAKALRREEGR
jgi:CubicO group peptidase (beta-lactamase class C family)